MQRAIVFDMGGTLDGDGLHWLDRFRNLYVAAGLVLPYESVRAAFDDAERRAADDEEISRAPLAAMVDRHVGWQFAYLELPSLLGSVAAARLRETVVAGFVTPVRHAARVNGEMLARLKAHGFVLGVISNGCGNVDVLCEDLGYARFLSVVVDSRRVGLYKPDPAIYAYAAARLGLPASSIMMVGDSFERDVRPAKSVGMKTAWLHGSSGAACPDPACVDVSLRVLADLPAALEARAWNIT